MAVAVIHLLETIEIAEDQGQPAFVATQGPLQLLEQAAAIEQAGEWIGQHLVHQHLLAGLALADVTLGGDPVGVPALGIRKGCHLDLHPVGETFAAVVQHFHVRLLPAPQALAESPRDVRVSVDTLEDARTAAKQFMLLKARLPQQGSVHIHRDRPRRIHRFRQRDQQCVLHGVDHAAQQLHEWLVPFGHGLVLHQTDADSLIGLEQAQGQAGALIGAGEAQIAVALLEWLSFELLGQGWPMLVQRLTQPLVGAHPEDGRGPAIEPEHHPGFIDQQQPIAGQQQKIQRQLRRLAQAARGHGTTAQEDKGRTSLNRAQAPDPVASLGLSHSRIPQAVGSQVIQVPAAVIALQRSRRAEATGV